MIGVGVSLRYLRGSAAGAFTLASLYAAEDDGFVFDDLTASAFVDTGGTTPWSVSGDPLGYLVDQREAYDAVAPTSAARPRLIVDEAGTFIRHDNLDDALTVSGLPNLGTSCTIGYVTRSEVRLLEGQTVNGTYTLPNDGDLAGLFVIDRELTLEEKVLAIRHLASKVEGVNYGAEIDRLALICLNAVDVLVIDTTLDTDGGTGMAVFPAQMVAVAEAAAVKLYDATSPDLPLDTTLDFTGYTVAALAYADGVLSVATTTGLAVFDLAAGDVTVALDYTTATTPAIVGNDVDGVAMLGADAAVATTGGGSIITDAGPVYDVLTGTALTRVAFSTDGELVALDSTGVAHIWTDPGSIAADGVAPDSTITFALGTPTVLEVA